MNTSRLDTHARFAAAFTLALAFTACGDDDPAPGGVATAGNAGVSNTGGNPGSAGSASPNGGQAVTAGSANTTSGSGGQPVTAGTSGTGTGGSSAGTGTGGSSAGISGSGGTAAGQAGMPAEGGASGAGGADDNGASGQGGQGGEGGQGPEETSRFGSGEDGSLTVQDGVNLSTANSGARSCADGGDAVSYAVTQLAGSAATLAAAPGAGCLAVGDEVLLINLQGTSTHFANVGNYETLRVSAISGSDVTFSKAKTRFYGDAADDDSNLGVARTNQRVMLQRVPNYQNVSVAAAGSLSANAWDGTKGGVVFFRAAGTVSIAGTLSMSGKGYAGGAQNTVVNSNGQQGESLLGLGSNAQAASQGAGGGGIGDGNACESFGASAGGGGYATPGGDGSLSCSGKGGSAYGDATLLSRLLLGSGGGAGGTDDVLSDNPPGGFGGRGGGIVVVAAANLQVTGTLDSAGSNGEGDLVAGCDNGGSITSCWDYSGPGGGGSGGSILLDASESALGAELVVASGGDGGLGIQSGNGGDGGDGRIAVRSSTLTGTTLPAATVD